MTSRKDRDAIKSWELAIKEKRKAGLLDGRFQPRNAEEQQLVDGKNDRENPSPD